MEPPNIILGIPGPWPTHRDIVRAIAGESQGYLFAGMILMDIETKDSFRLEISDHDPRMGQAFRTAGGERIPSSVLDAIGTHTHTLYLIGPGGSVDAARKVMRAGCGLLRAGGLAVKVESAGVAHAAETWAELTEREKIGTHRAFVVQLYGATDSASCGMHNLGRRDTVIGADDADPDYASRLIHRFQLYELLEAPILKAGQTFSLDAESPWFRISTEECRTYPPGDTFHNPYGMWRLTRIERPR